MKRLRQTGSIVIDALLVIVAIAVVVVIVRVVQHHHNAKLASNTATTSSTGGASDNGSSTNGTDNASLQNDLNAISGSNAQDSQNLQTTNAALNDQQSEVSVPTN